MIRLLTTTLTLSLLAPPAFAQQTPAGALLKDSYTIVWVSTQYLFFLQKGSKTYLCSWQPKGNDLTTNASSVALAPCAPVQ